MVESPGRYVKHTAGEIRQTYITERESCFKGSFPFCSFSLENTYKRVPYSVHVLSAKYRVQHENEAANLLLGERNACFAEKVDFKTFAMYSAIIKYDVIYSS